MNMSQLLNSELNASLSTPVLPHLLHKLYPARSVVHVGVGNGVGTMHQWRQWDVPNALMIDPIEAAWIAAAQASHPDWNYVSATVAASESSAIWHTSSNPAESGLFSSEQLQVIWPNIRTRQDIPTQVTHLDQLVGEYLPDWANTPMGNWLLLDCIPALPILQGAADTLARCTVIWVRAVLEPTLHDLRLGQLDEIQRLLEPLHFKKLAVMESLHPAIGEAVFVLDLPTLLDETKRNHEQSLVQNQAQLAETTDRYLRGESEQTALRQQLLSAQEELNSLKMEIQDSSSENVAEQPTSACPAPPPEQDMAWEAEKAYILQTYEAELAIKETARQVAEQLAEHLRQKNEELAITCAQAESLKDEAIAKCDSLKAESAALTQACEQETQHRLSIRAQLESFEQAQAALENERNTKASEHEHALAVAHDESKHLQHQLQEMRAMNEEHGLRGRLQETEFIKVEAQIELIKDLLLREPRL
jgi:hypothetical protein